MIRVHVPVQTHSTNEKRRAVWQKLARWAKAERSATAVMLCMETPPALPVTVTLTRLFDSKPLDGDNCTGALKAVRDAVALWLGCDDGDARVTWRYEQARGDVTGTTQIPVVRAGKTTLRKVTVREIGVIVVVEQQQVS